MSDTGKAAIIGAGETPGLPQQFLSRLEEILEPQDLNPVLATFAAPRKPSFHVNTLRASADDVLRELNASEIEATPVPGVYGAFSVRVEDRDRLLASSAYERAAIYVLNPSSLLPALALHPEPGERVLDLAAAPGGKTHHMACLMMNMGEILAVEVVRDRYYRLRANMDRLGATIVHPVRADGTSFWRRHRECFDRVLLDAPCSTEGRFSALDEKTTKYWSTRKIREMAGKQSRLLYSAIQSLRPGGTMVYATCSFAPEENELVVSRLLRQFVGCVDVIPTGLQGEHVRPGLRTWRSRDLPPELAHASRILPDDYREGFFICRLTKTASTIPARAPARRGRTSR